MTKRVYELAKESGLKVKTYWVSNDNYKTLDQTEYYMKDESLEKFADSIRQETLQECFQHLTNTGQDHAREILERYFSIR